MKKRLTDQQEFEIMKLVLDKFLWIGMIVMLFGLYRMFTETIQAGIYFLVAGAVFLILFLILIVKEYQIVK